MFNGDIKFVRQSRPFLKPFNYSLFESFLFKQYNHKFINNQNVVLIGDSLLEDVMFGNINNMVTVWVTKYKDKWKFKSG